MQDIIENAFSICGMICVSKGFSAGIGVTGKIINYPVSYISSSASEKLSQVNDHFYSFGTTWGCSEVKNWLFGKEATPFFAISDKTTAALIVASPMIGLAALRVLTGALGYGAKAAGKAVQFVGYNYLKESLDCRGDKLISLSTKKIETDLKIGAALTGIAGAILLREII